MMTTKTTLHIMHLSSVHPAQDTRILHRECRSLVEAGYRVTLVANADADFEEHGVQVLALPRNPGGRVRRMTSHVWQVLCMAIRENADAYHFHDPELIPVGLLLRFRGKQVIYDVHESVSKQILSKPWLPTRIRRAVASGYRVVERLVAPLLSGIVVATPGIAEYFPAGKTIVVQNFPVMSELMGSAVVSSSQREQLVAYVGSISEVRGAREMVEAVGLLPDDSQIRFEMGGPFSSERLEREVKRQKGAERTTFPGRLSRSEVAQLLSRATVGLVVLHPEPNYLDAYPVKLFEYMAAGLPVIASDFPFWRQFVQDVGSGLMVNPLDPQSIVDAILAIIDDPERARRMGMAGQIAVKDRFNWESEADKLIRFYDILLAK